MSGRIIEQLMLLSGWMGQTVLFTLCLCGFYLLSLRRFRLGGALIRIHGLFTALSRRRQLMLSGLYLRFLFILWCLFGMHFDRLLYAALMIGFCGFLCALDPRPKHLFAECANTILLLGGLYAAGLLSAYMREIQFEWNIFAVYVLLAVFIVLYTLYFFLRDVKEISAKRIQERAGDSKSETMRGAFPRFVRRREGKNAQAGVPAEKRRKLPEEKKRSVQEKERKGENE